MSKSSKTSVFFIVAATMCGWFFSCNSNGTKDVRVLPGVVISVRLKLPAGWKINSSAPNRLTLGVDKSEPPFLEISAARIIADDVKLPSLAVGSRYIMRSTVFYCPEKETEKSVCVRDDQQRVLVGSSQAGSSEVILEIANHVSR
jgi:hypothetical protein